ncbi:NERD domain-containing protein [Psychrobacter raelei]|uniref:nuclease-related domain-containing DEAD/DEAH box helicase n=1 Tax=Psychrobacter raelei TaxID=2565531 RepID=UPI003F603436
MRMIPNKAYDNDSNAELKVFDRLAQAFSGQEDSECFYALHSLNLTYHEYKRFSEIDFIIICPYGIYVLEVKGGRVSCMKGEWQFTDRYGKSNTSFESPFRQAQSALHGIHQKLKEALPEDIINQFALGYGVITPDCAITNQGAEWDEAVLAGSQQYRNLQGWLQRLFKHWQHKNKDFTASKEAIEAVVNYLRPSFEGVVYKADVIDNISRNRATLTESQLQLIEVIKANPRVICEGGAGTGKTLMAIRIALQCAKLGKQTAFICHSPWLQNFLAHSYSHPNLTIQTISGIRSQIRRNQLQVEVLIIDEAQDILNQSMVDALEQVLEGGFEGGRWYLFMDINQQSGLCGETDAHVLDKLKLYYPAKVPLTTNCRNTQQILQTIKNWIGADMGVKGAGEGLPVIKKEFENTQDLLTQINLDVHILIEKEAIDYSQITLLLSSSLSTALLNIEQDLISQLRADNHKVIRCDSYSMGHFPPSGISLLMTPEFKGLENDIVFYIGSKEDLYKNVNESYVAMSRARSLLYVYLT